jgi:curved DNA-binding protein CbpA
MRPLAELTHYEILDLSTEATPFEIRQAYQKALEVYSEDSMVIYSLFSSEERKEILARVDEAFATLNDGNARYQYDQTLIQQGIMKERPESRNLKERLAAVNSDSPGDAASPSEGKKQPPLDNPVVKEILSQEVLTGMDLKRLRTELGVSLEQITGWTKIRPNLLQFIEEDQFDKLPSRLHLKSFLRAYVQYFQLNPEPFVYRYMKRIGG